MSPVQFRHPGLALIVAAVLAETGLAAHRLELEITESVLMQNNDTTLTTLHQIHQLGVRRNCCRPMAATRCKDICSARRARRRRF